MKVENIDLAEASRLLGKCPRQVRRYVASGALPAGGGGPWNPLRFSRRDLLAFKSGIGNTSFRQREKWRGVIDADTLARIAHASVLRQENTGKYDFYLEGFTELWRLPVKTREGALRNCLPTLDAVPDSTRRWADRLGAALSPLEMDFVAGMLICRINPGVKLEESESKALGAALDMLKRSRPYLFYIEKTFQQTPEAWAAIEGAVLADVQSKYDRGFVKTATEYYREQFFGPERDQAWALYGRYHPTMYMADGKHVETSIGNLIVAVHRGEVETVLELVSDVTAHKLILDADDHPPQFPEVDEVKNPLTDLTKKMRIYRRQQNRPPSANCVGLVLGLKHRVQGCRTIQRIKRGLDRSDLIALFKDYLRCDVPRALKIAKQVEKDARPRYSDDECPECGAPIGFAAVCPECGHFLTGAEIKDDR